jgi:elongation factor G
VITPAVYAGLIVGDLNSRRGQIRDQAIRDDGHVVTAMVPLMDMFGYPNNLRAISQNRANFAMQFDHYAEAPPNNDDDPPWFRPAMGMRA